MKNEIRRLPDSELEVMQALWSCTPPVQRESIAEILEKTHPMAPTTLLTLLSRLSEKKFISIEKQGRRSCYIPLVSQEDYLASQGSRFFHKLCKGSISAFAAALCGSDISKEDLDELRRLLEEGEL